MQQRTRHNVRFIEPELLPKWAIIIHNREILRDQFYKEIDKPEPSQSMISFIKRAITDKRNQLAYYNYKFN